MKYLSFSLLSLITILSLSSCMRQQKPTNAYAARAYHKNAEEISSPSEFPADNRIEKVLLQLPEHEREQWKKQKYETVDEWALRIKNTLKSNASSLEKQKAQLNQLVETESMMAEEIRGLLERNELISKSIENSQKALSKVEGEINLIPPFRVYLVQKGDTLYRIAMQFYQTPKAMAKIMEWNRGWIRYPNQLMAGIPLLLYHDIDSSDANDKFSLFMSTLDVMRQQQLSKKNQASSPKG